MPNPKIKITLTFTTFLQLYPGCTVQEMIADDEKISEYSYKIEEVKENYL
jgi:hypothetical protein